VFISALFGFLNDTTIARKREAARIADCFPFLKNTSQSILPIRITSKAAAELCHFPPALQLLAICRDHMLIPAERLLLVPLSRSCSVIIQININEAVALAELPRRK